ncbi:MAG: hypothetical protein GXY42_06865 [Desulfovibrionales bacterium]|nr:hypothetical protein [Desulfovibrionales bacterium]
MPDKQTPPPQISPYLFPFGLACFAVWFFYDGWITTDVEMQKHLLFNRVGSVIFTVWAVFDFLRTRRSERERKARQQAEGETAGS